MAEGTLLVVDDEPAIVDLLTASLTHQGFEVISAADGTKALELARRRRPDVIVTDVMMPGLDGFDLVRTLRYEGITMPAIFLTARDSVEDRVVGLTIGGDDYVTKPFSLAELVARIRIALRRGSAHLPVETSDQVLRYGDLEVDEQAHQVRKAGALVDLSPTEFRLLAYLVDNAETVVSRGRILDHVWEYSYAGEPHVVETYISYLRKKIDTTEPRLIHTVRGVGYVLRRPA